MHVEPFARCVNNQMLMRQSQMKLEKTATTMKKKYGHGAEWPTSELTIGTWQCGMYEVRQLQSIEVKLVAMPS